MSNIKEKKSFEIRDKQLAVELEKVHLHDGNYITMPVRGKRKEPSLNYHKSEIFIEISDHEESGNENVLSSVYENSENSSLLQMTMPDINVLQDNTSAQRNVVNLSDKEKLMSIRESHAYCKFQNKYYFLLRFKATNVRVSFIQQEKRRLPPEWCDKSIQISSKYKYQNYIDSLSTKYMLTKRNYTVMKNSTKYWRSRSLRAVFSSDKYESTPQKEDLCPMSRTQKHDTKGYLYLNYNDITFLIHPMDLTLESIKPLYDDDFLQGKSSIDTLSSAKNRGSFLGRYKNDLMVFKFDLESVNFEQIWVKTSRASQCVDSNTYARYYSDICSRFTHCPIPLSTYKYNDPMIKIKYDSKKHMFYGTKPAWMREETRKRLNSFCKLDIQKSSRSVDLSVGSTIQFKTDCNSFCKAKTGIHKAFICIGELNYEQMIIDYQRHEPTGKKKENDIYVLADSKHTSMEILDCDIVSHNF